MAGGYHRLSPQLMEERDNVIINLVKEGLKHKIIACQVRMAPAAIEARLQKLRLEGKLEPVGERNG